MEVAAALLCDAASVREGLLFVLGGGITRVWRDSYPAPLGCSGALMLAVHQMELDRPHEIDLLVQGEDGQEIARVKGAFQVAGQDLDVGEPLLVPVTLDLRSVGIPSPGRYSIEISVDGQHRCSMTFRARLAQERVERA